MRALPLVMALVTGSALTLGAQDARLGQRFSPAEASRLQLLVDSAGNEHLPTDPLVLRALEGQAKGASVVEIVNALERLRSALRSARGVLGATASTDDVTTAGAALEVGMPVTELQELRRLRGKDAITPPLNAWLDLVARGASPGRTWSRISDLARQRAPDADFSRLTPADIGHDPPPSRPPGDHP